MQGILSILSGINIRGAPEDYGLPAVKGAQAVPLSAENFHSLDPVDGARIGFVDGGNNTIYLAPGQAVHMVRLYYVVFRHGRREESGRYTFIVETNFDVENELFLSKIHDVNSSGILPESMSIGMDEIDEREKIRGVGSYVRRIGEWLLSTKILERVDILVRDGSLQTGAKKEFEYADEFFRRAESKVVVGFSKTCALLTDRGYSLVASIHHLSKREGVEAPWYYHPIARGISTIKGDMFAVKLHPRADYVFRVEVYPEERAEYALGALVPMANDPVFLGYPYGLLDADVYARITDEEADMYSQMLYNSAGEFGRMQANALNSHDIISEVK